MLAFFKFSESVRLHLNTGTNSPQLKAFVIPQIIHINLSSLDYLTKQAHFTVKSYRLAVGLLCLMTLKGWNLAIFSSLTPYLLRISSECSPKTGLCVEETEAGVWWGGNGTHENYHLLLIHILYPSGNEKYCQMSEEGSHMHSGLQRSHCILFVSS